MKTCLRLYSAIFLTWATATVAVRATTYTASSTASISNYAAAAGPGDTIVVADGIYSSGSSVSAQVINIIPTSGGGTATNPIVIEAADAGQVVFTGPTTFTIGTFSAGSAPTSYITVTGFRFDNVNNTSSITSPVVLFQNAANSRLTQCAFIGCGNLNSQGIGGGQSGTTGTEDHVIQVLEGSTKIRIDHNFFRGSLSQCISLLGASDSYAIPNEGSGVGPWHWIDHNLFQDIECVAGNGSETIQNGQDAPHSMTPVDLVIEYNLQDDTFGNFELISNKTSNNDIRYNTFENALLNYSTLELRAGRDNVVEGNFLFDSAEGITAVGSDQVIQNNYLYGTTNPDTGASFGAITLPVGLSEAYNTLYQASARTLVANNTIAYSYNASTASYADNEYGIFLGQNFATNGVSTFGTQDPGVLPNVMPYRSAIYNNIVYSANGQLIANTASTRTTWSQNCAYLLPGGSGTPSAGYTISPGIINGVDPNLTASTSDPDYYQLSSSTPATISAQADASTGYCPTDDINGQTRGPTYAIGAAQYTTSAPLRYPLVSTDVGPSWMGGPATDTDQVVWGPSSASAVAAGPTYVVLSWAASDPAAPNGYEYRYRSDGISWTTNPNYYIPNSITSVSASNLKANGAYYFQVRALTGNDTGSGWSPYVFQMTPDGYIESSNSGVDTAETNSVDYVEKANPTSTYGAWTVANSTSGYSGTIGYMSASSTSGQASWTASPGMDYNLLFNDAGTYNVWARCYAPNSSSATFRWGVNGNEVSDSISGVAVPSASYSSWAWVDCGTWTVPTGSLSNSIQTLNLRRRDPDLLIDAVYLTTSSSTPSGVITENSAIEAPYIMSTATPSASPLNATTSAATYLVTVTASGNPAPTYQWETVSYSSSTTSNESWAPLTGGTGTQSAACTITSPVSGYYAVAATNVAGTATSSAFNVGFVTAPSFLSSITVSPSATISVGSTATIAIQANLDGDQGNATWYLNGTAVHAGAGVSNPNGYTATNSTLYYVVNPATAAEGLPRKNGHQFRRL